MLRNEKGAVCVYAGLDVMIDVTFVKEFIEEVRRKARQRRKKGE